MPGMVDSQYYMKPSFMAKIQQFKPLPTSLTRICQENPVKCIGPYGNRSHRILSSLHILAVAVTLVIVIIAM